MNGCLREINGALETHRQHGQLTGYNVSTAIATHPVLVYKNGMTPAINVAKKANIAFVIHEYTHDPAAGAYGKEAAEKLGIAPERVFKTLVVANGKELAVAVVPVLRHLDLKLLAKALCAKKVAMAEVRQVERTTGYVVGGVSPLGQKKPLPTIIDASAEQFDTIFVSAGRRGLDIELAPQDLAALVKGSFSPVAK